MSAAIAQKFNTFSLLKFAAPSIIMMVFMSLYTIVDGVFVSRFVSSDALASLNIVYPTASVLFAFAVMLSTGSSAVVAYKMGEGKLDEARQVLSMIALWGVIISAVFGAVCIIFAEEISLILGADRKLLADCVAYLVPLIAFAPVTFLQCLYQMMFVTAGRPKLGLFLTVLAGFANMLFDYIFIAVLHMGITGAALATGIGQTIPALAGTVFFFHRNKELYYQKFRFMKNEFFKSCTNGSSEMVTNLSTAVITVAFNIIMMRFAGSDGVAAITIILYAQFMLSSLFMGFAMGVAPVFGYRLGAELYKELREIFSTCIKFVTVVSVLLTAAAFAGAGIITGVFADAHTAAGQLACHGMRIFSFAYLFAGMNIFASGFFTAISDGKRSAAISFLRTFVFIIGSVLTLPYILEIDGVWLSIPAAEFLTIFVSIALLKHCSVLKK